MNRSRQIAVTLAFFCAVPVSSAFHGALLPQTEKQVARKPALPAEEIVSRLEEKNLAREAMLREIQGRRIYRVDASGFFGSHHAEAVVEFSYVPPHPKEFRIVSQSGSTFVVNHVIKKLLEAEKEAGESKNRERTALTSRNYEFALPGDGLDPDALQYVLNVAPKTDYKYLYRGKVWIDATDFAVARIEAEPAENPSFWIKRTAIIHTYKKIGDLWLPAEDKSESWMRFGGQAHLSIEYTDYKVVQTPAPAAGAKVSAPQ